MAENRKYGGQSTHIRGLFGHLPPAEAWYAHAPAATSLLGDVATGDSANESMRIPNPATRTRAVEGRAMVRQPDYA